MTQEEKESMRMCEATEDVIIMIVISHHLLVCTSNLSCLFTVSLHSITIIPE